MIARGALLLSCIAVLSCSGQGETSSRPEQGSVERQLLDAINAERRSRDLSPLEWSEKAAEVARTHSEAMAKQSFFAHEDPKRGTPAERLSEAGVEWRAVAENIHSQKGYDNPVRRAIESWLDSPGHRKNLLSKQYTHTGIGAAKGPDGVTYYTQIFFTPLK